MIWFFGLQFVFIKWLDYELDFFLITDKRVIGYEQIGFLNRKTVQASIDQIQEVYATNKGIFANFISIRLNQFIDTQAQRKRVIFIICFVVALIYQTTILKDKGYN